MYDSTYFDRIVNRKNTSSLKYDFGLERKGRDDLLPLWVADMDFPAPEEVLEALQERVRHGIFGYTDPDQKYLDSVKSWFLNKYDWEIKADSVTVTPGVVYAIATAIRAFTQRGDHVFLQQPVYYPFLECITDNDRIPVNSQLVYENGRYRIDFEDFEKKVRENQVKLILLCSPHNPVGRVWSREELMRIGEIALTYHVIVFSDEIHCDITYPGSKHIPFLTVRPEFQEIAAVGTSPSKTFNLAGLQTSNIIIPDPSLRKRFRKENAAAGYSQGNVLGMTACRAAYEKGDAWYQGLLRYLKENLDYLRDFVHAKLPGVRLVEPEGTYLVWLDFTELCVSSEELEHLITDKARLWLDAGRIFGEETALFERVNIACPRRTLETAMERLKGALYSERQYQEERL